jgi:hypothetical protein
MNTNKSIILLALLTVLSITCDIQAQNNIAENQEYATGVRDIYADTWVGADTLGRTIPSFKEVGSVKQDKRRITGIFYSTWYAQDKAKMSEPYNGDGETWISLSAKVSDVKGIYALWLGFGGEGNEFQFDNNKK